jgi:hypothetical protein
MTSGNNRGRVTGLVFNPWNLLLIVPFVVLLTPIYNSTSPELFGMPFFYWFQFLIIGVGVLCTITVYRMTRGVPVDPAPGVEPDVDTLDERRLDERRLDERRLDEEKPAETEPAETDSAETESAEEKPAEADPAETDPAETESAEADPAETESAETESAEEKPAEGRDV